MKKSICVILSITIVFSLCSISFASNKGASLSPQKLSVNGKHIECEKYNINDYNYFKLRDIAKLLSGTESQFEVGWDESSQTITITTGEPYTEVGGELVQRGDYSTSAKPSSQTIKINGKNIENLSVYIIGNNNFFKLRDLSAAIGFQVDYDASTDTAMVVSAGSEFVRQIQETVEISEIAGDNSEAIDKNVYKDESQLLASIDEAFSSDGIPPLFSKQISSADYYYVDGVKYKLKRSNYGSVVDDFLKDYNTNWWQNGGALYYDDQLYFGVCPPLRVDGYSSSNKKSVDTFNKEYPVNSIELDELEYDFWNILSFAVGDQNKWKTEPAAIGSSYNVITDSSSRSFTMTVKSVMTDTVYYTYLDGFVQKEHKDVLWTINYNGKSFGNVHLTEPGQNKVIDGVRVRNIPNTNTQTDQPAYNAWLFINVNDLLEYFGINAHVSYQVVRDGGRTEFYYEVRTE